MKPPDTSRLADQKSRDEARQRLRTQLRKARASIDNDSAQRAAHALCANLKHYLLTRSSQTLNTEINVAGYLAVGGEMSLSITHQWLQESGCKTHLPVVENDTLRFAPFNKDTQFSKGKFNIDIPIYQEQELQIAEQMQIVLVPLVSFDETGNRLGMGGGFYDRTFEFRQKNGSNSQLFIGIAYDLQKSDKIPVEFWDIPLDAVITEQNIYSINS